VARALTTNSNLELKARDPNPRQTLAAARAVGGHDRGGAEQIDTFFWVPSGRLKLREGDAEPELIHYERADEPGPARSTYVRLPVADAGQMRTMLATHLGILGVVRKHRRLLVESNVRIHLDRVEGLGDFVEIEVVAPPGTRPENQLDRLNALRRALGIADERLVADAYIDQLLAAPGPSAYPEGPPPGPD
jgi:adenylate cyclase